MDNSNKKIIDEYVYPVNNENHEYNKDYGKLVLEQDRLTAKKEAFETFLEKIADIIDLAFFSDDSFSCTLRFILKCLLLSILIEKLFL